jgi:hypothetical protein
VFERAQHERIAVLLRSLDGRQLREHHCYFGGGTAIVLRHGEYRESNDVDFIVADIDGYRGLRRAVGSPAGIGVLFAEVGAVQPLHDVRADQYGIRSLLAVADTRIKFGIVFEARIDLDPPAARDEICGIASLTRRDMAASKLLANSDRWADDGVFSRDLIDLAMIEISAAEWREAVGKAQGAYGEAIRRDLGKAIERMKTREGWLERCMQSLSITRPKAVIVEHLRRLQRRLEAP